MPRRHPSPLLMITVLLGGVGIVACTLNPQPLPPKDDDDRVNSTDPEQSPGAGGTTADAGALPPSPEPKGDASFSQDGAASFPDGGALDASPVDATVDGGNDGSTSPTDADATD